MSDIISGCGKTEEECYAYYTQQKKCPKFVILDSDALDEVEPSNCVHRNNWLDRLVDALPRE